jgi:hypothetical protein
MADPIIGCSPIWQRWPKRTGESPASCVIDTGKSNHLKSPLFITRTQLVFVCEFSSGTPEPPLLASAFGWLLDLTNIKRGPMTVDKQREDQPESFARVEEKAREVLKERGLTPEQIEAQLKKPKRLDPYDL